MLRIFNLVEYFRPTYARVGDEEVDQDNEQVPPDHTEDEVQPEHSGRGDEKRCPACTHQRTRIPRRSSDLWWPWIAHAVLFCTSAVLLGLSLTSPRDMQWEETRVFCEYRHSIPFSLPHLSAC
jgi:hypothetical protein